MDRASISPQMEIAKFFSPDPIEISRLCRMSGEIVVAHRKLSPWEKTPVIVVLHAAQGADLSISVDTDSAAPKFDCFRIRIEDAQTDASASPLQEVDRFANWQTIRCLFRFEWRRPARSGEVPARYVQRIGERGRRERIPTGADPIAVSMVGLAFWDRELEAPSRLLMTDDDRLQTVRLCKSQDEIAPFLAECEIVDLAAVASWRDELRKGFGVR